MLTGKFGRYSDSVSAVWFWNKLKLRGGSRGKGGAEFLAYYKGGFAKLADELRISIEERGGKIHLKSEIKTLQRTDAGTILLETTAGRKEKDLVVLTPALPVIAQLLKSSVSSEYYLGLNAVKYIGNVCLVLQLSKSLSDVYWLNVNDPNFPFVGIIEHTNFEPVENYGGRHIVYLSKYLPVDDKLYNMSGKEFFEYSVPYIKRMFPGFQEEWVLEYDLWKEPYSQPIVSKYYSKIIPHQQTPIENVMINTMAQIYPEDRGTNYAIREGKKMAFDIIKKAELNRQ